MCSQEKEMKKPTVTEKKVAKMFLWMRSCGFKLEGLRDEDLRKGIIRFPLKEVDSE